MTRTAQNSSSGLREAPSIFELQADSPEEALAFLYTTIDRLPPEHAKLQVSRCIIASTAEAATVLGKSPTPLVILIEASKPGLAAELMQQGHHVLIAHGSQVGASDRLNTLSRPDFEVFKDSLLAMGFVEERASALARDSARKLTILRRLIPSTAVVTHPDWAAGENGKLLLPALLAGAWDTTSPGDRKALETLSGSSFEDFQALADDGGIGVIGAFFQHGAALQADHHFVEIGTTEVKHEMHLEAVVE